MEDKTQRNNPLVSVIIPVYNGEKYLATCLDTVIHQTYKNMQIILIDDGSTDSSGTICDSYALRDGRIEVLHCENGGQAKARNIGLTMARGEWIGFVDDDDTIDADMYSVLINNAMRHNVLISGCSTLMIEENGEKINKFSDMESGIRSGKDIILDLFYYSPHTYGALWNKVFHKSLINELFFPEGCQLEDYYVAIKVYYKAVQVYFEQRPMYHWYLRSSSQSHKAFYDGKLTIMRVCQDITDWIVTNTEDDDLIMGAYHYRFVSYVNVMSLMWRSKESKKKVREYLDEAFSLYKKAVKLGCHSAFINKSIIKCYYWKFFA